MDNFLTQLYEEEQEKVASADMQEFMDTLSVRELEAFLGLDKSAGIPGPDEAPMPAGKSGSEVVDRAKAREERGAEAQKAADKAAEEADKEKASGCGVKHASAAWADQLGRFIAHGLAKEAAGADTVSVSAGDPWAPPLDPDEGARQGKRLGKIMGGTLGTIYGGVGGAALGSKKGVPGMIAGGLGGAAAGGLGLGYGGGKLFGHLGRKGSEEHARRVQSDISALKKMKEKKASANFYQAITGQER